MVEGYKGHTAALVLKYDVLILIISLVKLLEPLLTTQKEATRQQGFMV